MGYRTQIRDGIDLWCKGPLPIWQVPQRYEKDATIRDGMHDKITVVRGKGYMGPGLVRSLTSYFAVQKGLYDI